MLQAIGGALDIGAEKVLTTLRQQVQESPFW
jgi:hypothetical protein